MLISQVFSNLHKASLNKNNPIWSLECDCENHTLLQVTESLFQDELRSLFEFHGTSEDVIPIIHSHFDEIIGSSESFKKVLRNVEKVASTDATVLILGETGTGKELIARALHRLSPRKDRPLVKVNCAALPNELIERSVSRISTVRQSPVD